MGVGSGLDSRSAALGFSLYMILSSSILCGKYYNNGGSEGNIILRNSLGDDQTGAMGA